MAKTNKLLEAITEINNLYGDKESGVAPIVLGKPVVKSISTGSFALDYATNFGGLPEGRLFEFYGAEASGKTTAALQIAKQFLANGDSVLFVDMEAAFSPDWGSKLGIKYSTKSDIVKNPDKAHFIIVEPTTFKETFDEIRKFLNAGIKLVILDSIPALVSSEEINGEEIEGKGMPVFAKNLKSELKSLNNICAKLNANIIFINHLMEKITTFGYGDKKTTPGGKALKFFSSMRMEFARVKTIKDNNDVKIANRVEVNVTKNKLAAPYGKAQFTLNFLTGWDYIQEIIDFSIQYGIIEKENPRLYNYNGSKFATSAPELEQKIKNDVTLQETLKTAIREKMKQEIELKKEMAENIGIVNADDATEE